MAVAVTTGALQCMLATAKPAGVELGAFVFTTSAAKARQKEVTRLCYLKSSGGQFSGRQRVERGEAAQPCGGEPGQPPQAARGLVNRC